MQSQEKHEQQLKLSKKEEETQRQWEKQREIEQKAQQKYKDWLQKKNQEKIEMEKKAKVMWIVLLVVLLLVKIFQTQCFVIIDEQKLQDCYTFVLTGGSYSEGGAGERAPQDGGGEV